MDSLDRKAAAYCRRFPRESHDHAGREQQFNGVHVYLLNQQVVPGLQLFDLAKEPDAVLQG
ncbi:MAG: hypothetical protein MZV63_25020 [Marinilabiliales bacterium]|nr:hypothetical protein [Marinilabiliales bacterium]